MLHHIGPLFYQLSRCPFGLGLLVVIAPKVEKEVSASIFFGPIWLHIGVELD